MKRDVAGQTIGAQMFDPEGAAFTGSVSVSVTKDHGTQTAGGGTAPSHKGNGFHSYQPTQGETDADHIAFTFTGSGAVPVTVQVYTSFPQSGDAYQEVIDQHTNSPSVEDIADEVATRKLTPIDVDGLTHASLMEAILAAVSGVADVSGSPEDPPIVITYMRRDGTTAKLAVTVGSAPGIRTASVIDPS